MGLAVSDEVGSSGFPFFPFWREALRKKVILKVNNTLPARAWGEYWGAPVSSGLTQIVSWSFCLLENRGNPPRLIYVQNLIHWDLQCNANFAYIYNFLRVSPLTVTVRLAEGLQRRERMIQKRTRRKTAREMRGNASIRTRITRGRQEKGTWETDLPSGYFTCL